MDLSGSMQGAGGVGGLLSVRIGSSDYYPTFDGNGNVSEYLDSSGTVQAHYEYDAFGNEVTSVADKGTKHDDFSHRFSTKPLDAETGLYYYGYRYYDPVTGRWPSRDPIGEDGGMNLYGFVGNNGVNSWDYLGFHEGEIWENNRRAAKKGQERRKALKELACCDSEKVAEGKKTLMRRFKRALDAQNADGVRQNEPRPEEGGVGDWSCHTLNDGLRSELSRPAPMPPTPLPRRKGGSEEDQRRRTEMLTEYKKKAGIPECWTCVLERRSRDTGERIGVFRRPVLRDHWAVTCSGQDKDAQVIDVAEFDLWESTSTPGGNPNKGFRRNYPKLHEYQTGGVRHRTCVGPVSR